MVSSGSGQARSRTPGTGWAAVGLPHPSQSKTVQAGSWSCDLRLGPAAPGGGHARRVRPAPVRGMTHLVGDRSLWVSGLGQVGRIGVPQAVHVESGGHRASAAIARERVVDRAHRRHPPTADQRELFPDLITDTSWTCPLRRHTAHAAHRALKIQITSAWARQSSVTGQRAQITFGGRGLSPFSGWKTSESVWAHSASWCQRCGSVAAPSHAPSSTRSWSSRVLLTSRGWWSGRRGVRGGWGSSGRRWVGVLGCGGAVRCGGARARRRPGRGPRWRGRARRGRSLLGPRRWRRAGWSRR